MTVDELIAEEEVSELLEEAVRALWERVASMEARSISEAVDQLWPLELAEEDRETCVRVGLIAFAHRRQSATKASGKPPIAWGAPHGVKWLPYMQTFSQPYEDADGQEKPLSDFGPLDVAAFVTRCRNLAKGWKDRERVGIKMGKALTEYGVERIGDLPASVQTDLAAELEEVWS